MSDEASKDSAASTDDSLAQLLDSALADLNIKDKDDGAKSGEAAEDKSEATPENQLSTAEAVPGQVPNFEDIWSKCFSPEGMQQMSGLFENNPEGDEFKANFSRLAETCQRNFTEPINSNTDITSAFTQALQELNQGPGEFPGAEEMLGMLNSGELGDNLNEMMAGMMDGLFSKDVFAPSLRHILEKFPAWLEKNAATLSEEDKARYAKQQDLMKEIVAEFDLETEADTKEVRRERSKKIVEMVGKLEQYGQPPTELLDDMAATPLPNMPIDPTSGECSIS